MTRSLPYYREVCVDTLEDAIQAELNGADQIELCSRLDLDGLTPSNQLLEQIFSKVKIPIKPMLRLRGGDFIYTRREKDTMLQSLELIKQFDCKSIVFGALKIDGRIDQAFLREIIEAMGDHIICFHKAIDYSTDILESCSVLSTFEKVVEILSSGGAQTARGGVETLIEMKKNIRPDQKLIAAGKIRPENLSELHNLVNLEYYHGKKIINY